MTEAHNLIYEMFLNDYTLKNLFLEMIENGEKDSDIETEMFEIATATTKNVNYGRILKKFKELSKTEKAWK